MSQDEACRQDVEDVADAADRAVRRCRACDCRRCARAQQPAEVKVGLIVPLSGI